MTTLHRIFVDNVSSKHCNHTFFASLFIILSSVSVCVFQDITSNNRTSIPSMLSFSKISCFSPSRWKHCKQRCWIYSPWKAFSKSSVFSNLKCHLRVRWAKTHRKALFKEIPVCVWTLADIYNKSVWAPHWVAMSTAENERQRVKVRWTDSMDGWMDGWMGGWMDGWMDGRSGYLSIQTTKLWHFFNEQPHNTVYAEHTNT